MNIFALDSDPKYAAIYHNDRHVVKMTLESLQLLCSAHIMSGDEAPYRLTHKNHPCSIWTRESTENYDWLSCLFEYLLEEYTFRYQKIHACSRYLEFSKRIPKLNRKKMTPFVLAMPDEYKTNDPISSYRKYYYLGKSHLAKWTNREAPYWYIQMDNEKEKEVSL